MPKTLDNFALSTKQYLTNNLHYNKYIVPVAPIKGDFNFLLFWCQLI